MQAILCYQLKINKNKLNSNLMLHSYQYAANLLLCLIHLEKMMAKKKNQTLKQCKQALRDHISAHWPSQRAFADHLNVHVITVTRILADNKHKPTEAMLSEMNWQQDPETFSEK